MTYLGEGLVSRAYGIDNDLCIPYRSISYWALLVIGATTLLQLKKHAAANAHLAFLLLIINLASLLLTTSLRIKIYKLGATLKDENQIVVLRAISSYSTRLTGAALVACFIGASAIKVLPR